MTLTVIMLPLVSQIALAIGLPYALLAILNLLRLATHKLLHVTKLDTITNDYATMAVNITMLIVWAALPFSICIHMFDGVPLLLASLICICIVLCSITLMFDEEFIKDEE